MIWLDDYLSGKGVRGRTLVVGSKQYKTKPDRRELYDYALGLDLESGPGVDIVFDLENPLPESFGKFDHIDCVSVLEHVQRPWILCANIERLMKPNATILVSVPFVWRVHAYPSDYWRITANTLPILFPNIEWQERGYTNERGWVKKAEALTVDGMVYMQKTEVVAFGIRNPDNARHLH